LTFDIKRTRDEPGRVSVLEVANRLKDALDVERMTKQFYADFRKEYLRFLEYIDGIDDERDRRCYASVLLNRLMFIYFLQRKWFIDNGNINYLQDKLAESRRRGSDLYYSEFLNLLFFEGFAKPEDERSDLAKKMLGKVVYLNGGLFLPHPIEKRWPTIQIPDLAFENLFSLFSRYSWNLDDTPGGQDNEISPHVLGYIFEKYINQKSFGAYYTLPEITEYLCERTIHKLILEKINTSAIPGIMKGRHFDTMEELLINLDARLCRDLLDVLPKISLLDPACGSGAFLVSAMNTLTKIYGAITGRIEYLNDPYLTSWLKKARSEHNSLNYSIKKRIITENLYGVDIMEEGTEIARLRLFLALVSSVQSVDQLEPLPNIDFNILPGNSLIGLLHVNENVYDKRLAQLNLFQKHFREVVEEKNRLIRDYKDTSKYTRDLRVLCENIQAQRDAAIANLNELLLDELKQLGVRYEQATWDNSKNADGKPIKRALKVDDISELQPFHWGYEFDQVMNERGGFDVIITNPPWDILKPQAKEFLATHSKLVSKNKMRIEEFEQEQAKLLQNAEIRDAWLDYQSRFPYQSAYFRATQQYENQVSTVNGKKQGTDINLYKLFTEQCYNLLREGGQCGIVLPSGIYTDLGAKQLREMLFSQTQVTSMFCFENRKSIFEGVDSRFKFVVLTFEKGGQTQEFPAAFMRHDVVELERFPKVGALDMSVNLIRRLSPDSLSVMEFRHETDVQIARKMLKAPLLKEEPEVRWDFTLTNEFHMTNDSYLFKTAPQGDYWPLYEGKMIHQFNCQFSEPRYWINIEQGRSELVRQEMRRVEEALDALAILQGNVNNAPTRQERVAAFLKTLGWGPLTPLDVRIAPDMPRLVCRSIARNTDERTMIATILPSNVFTSNSLNYLIPWRFDSKKVLDGSSSLSECYEPTMSLTTLAYLCGVLNSFTLDYVLRSKISANVNMFYLYQLPVPRPASDNPLYKPIVRRVAQLVCVGPEFDELRAELLGNVNAYIATNEGERRQIQYEIDGLVAHLYGLTEGEFRYVLSTFPLVKQPVKDAALNAYHQFALDPDDLALSDLIPIPELVPGLPEILPGTGHSTRPLDTHARPPHKIVDAFRGCQFNPERDRALRFIGPGPALHAQRLGSTHLNQ
jgi:intergrase/recombinase